MSSRRVRRGRRWRAGGEPSRPRPGRPGPVRDADAADVRLRIPRRRPRPVSRRPQPRRLDDRGRAHPHAHRRHDHLALADDARRSAGAAPRARGRVDPDGGRRRRVRGHRLGAAAHRRGDDRGHLADRQRGRSVPRHRAGRPVADRARHPAHGHVRLVQPRRLPRDGQWRARGRAGQPAPAGSGRAHGGRLPGGRHRLRRDRSGHGGRLLAARRRHRAAAPGTNAGRHPRALRPASIATRRLPAVGPLLARRVCGRVHPAKPDGVLVPRPVRRGAGGPRGHLLRRQPAGRRLVAVRCPDRGADRTHQHDGLHPSPLERPADPASR